jgi:xanthine dehydrogenase molybdenum-binding subunit
MKVLERACGHATGAYIVNVVDLKATAAYTNNVPCGAMRGFGVNQAAFAMESCIDDLCAQGGFDRWQIRWDNAIRDGVKTSVGEVIKEGAGVRACLEAVKDQFKGAKYAGIACGIKNSGIGNGMPDIGIAKVVVESPDRIVLHHGWTEMGQGVHTVAIQTAVEETGLSPELFEVRVHTREETVCGMTTSSRGTVLVGNSLIPACRKLREDLLKSGSVDKLVGNVYHGEWICDWTTELGDLNPGTEIALHYSYGYAAQVAILDDQGRIAKVVAAHDAGRIMNPLMFEGQIEGAIHMGLGYALTEDFPVKEGFPVHDKFQKLGILRAKQMPEMEIIGIEKTDPNGPYGAKGVGEIGLVPTAAAVVNALCCFDGKRRYSLPTGEKSVLPE